jgi:FkbM family methyltransferase
MHAWIYAMKRPLSIIRGHCYIMRHHILEDPLNRGQRLRLISNYIRWQTLHKYRNRQWVISLENGFRSIVYPYPDHDAGELNIWTRNVDFHDTCFIRSLLQKGDTVVDAGCNVGNRTLALADLIGGALLIDGGKRAVERAEENLRLNGLDLSRFVVLCTAVGDRSGVVRFTDVGGASTQNRVIDDAAVSTPAIAMPVTTIDEEVAKLGMRPAFIKIDVEGYDLLALRGSERTLRSGAVRLVKFEHNQSEPLQPFESFFGQLGWRIFALDRDGKPSVEPATIARNQNLFSVHDDCLPGLLRMRIATTH